ncbi:helix-turn-helix domain-containing protein [Nocardioides sp.]|uniref:winged helix-turn-helix transcriptional regulator n=1 Tax=Nocardioides sp. TaxID=35761 RepID=UPI002603BCC6|nr:helix-turn-helix domain-containing protein [Nocardioides sp.]
MSTAPDLIELQTRFPGGVFPADCPSRALLDHVMSKWGVLVLVSLAERPHRWSELRRRAEGVSEKMLAQTLKILEADGFVHREQQPVMPPRVDYSLTRAGEELALMLRPLLVWLADHAEQTARDDA